MNSPFQFGNVVTDDNFVNRADEIKKLHNNFRSSINTIIISPRRWGKSSLVKQATKTLKDRNIRFVFIDFFNIRTEEDFYKIYAREVIKASVTRTDELLKTTKDFFKKIIPRFSFGIDPINDFSVSFDWKEAKKDKDEILNLSEEIAKKNKLKIVICIDEFQKLNELDNSADFEKLLRSCWQYHKNSTYCLYGSQRHMMSNIFRKESRPFYKFGDLMILTKIEKQHWIKYITNAFSNRKKIISENLADKIATIAQNHPYYVQQLANEVWYLTSKKVTEDIIKISCNNVVNTNKIFYQSEIEHLSNMQINLLKAIISNVEQLTSRDAMNKFKIGTPRNVVKNKIVLEERDIVDFSSGKSVFVDPFFELWFRDNFNN